MAAPELPDLSMWSRYTRPTGGFGQNYYRPSPLRADVPFQVLSPLASAISLVSSTCDIALLADIRLPPLYTTYGVTILLGQWGLQPDALCGLRKIRVFSKVEVCRRKGRARGASPQNHRVLLLG